MHALFDIVVTFGGQLMAGEAPSEMTNRMIRRLARDGRLPAVASPGDLAALIDDLCQRLHYAMGAGDALPDPLPAGMVHVLRLPSQSSARAAHTELTTLGGTEASVDAADGEWNAFARFSEHPPDQSFLDRQRQLEDLARRHGGRYVGAQR
jgi:hypothetical protein